MGMRVETSQRLPGAEVVRRARLLSIIDEHFALAVKSVAVSDLPDDERVEALYRLVESRWSATRH